MIHLDSEDRIIRRAFPCYDREKSVIIDEFGCECNGFIIAKIYRKGTYRLEMEGGKLVTRQRVK